MNCVTDNKKFWKTVKPLFTDKVQTSSSITLVENEKIITNDSEIAEIFNEFFTNITKTMDIAPGECILVPTKHKHVRKHVTVNQNFVDRTRSVGNHVKTYASLLFAPFLKISILNPRQHFLLSLLGLGIS